MNLRVQQLLKLHKLYAPAGEADGGGGETTTIDDGDGGDTGDGDGGDADRGDEVDPPLDAEALARVAGEGGDDDGAGGQDTAEGSEGSDAAANTSGKRGSTHIPVGRFNEVNEEKKRLERENEELRKKVGAAPAPTPVPTPAPTQPPKPKFDEAAAEKEYATLLAEGEFDKAVTKRQEINAHIREQAREEAEQNVEQRITQRATAQTLTQVANQAVKDFPYLDTEEGADTMELIIAARDGYVAKGMPIAQALKQAVDKIAPKYAPPAQQGAGTTPGKDSQGKPPAGDTRSREANARGAADSTKQPPKLEGGAGNRATQGKVAVEDLDDDQFDALPEAEKRRLRGDEG